ncbi:MAG: hypothetical protein ACRBFS_08625 [Aureispira sp.]
MYIKVLLFGLFLGVLTSCAKEPVEGLAFSKVRIGYILLKDKPDSLKIISEARPASNIWYSKLYVTCEEGTSPPPANQLFRNQVFKRLPNQEGPSFFDQLFRWNEYTYLEQDKTYTLTLFHNYSRLESPTLFPEYDDEIDNITFNVSDHLPNSNNQFSLRKGDLEFIISVYQ